MKIKSLLAYVVPVLVLVVLGVAIKVWLPASSSAVGTCERYVNCVVISPSVPSWLGIR
ncbi:hypothetical protein [Pseudomonas poae]|uniref:hypothetical protein n=1 Tax=Pseudomonas poae TaxID=200451 RepID=UPI0015E2C3D0|nr:hypothetical protein [Pseudomonas poae]